MENIEKLLQILTDVYPDARTELRYNSPYELLIAAILSAQSTDSQVNRITSRLFRKYAKPQDLAVLSPQDLEMEIRGCGLYRKKSRYIVAVSRAIMDLYSGCVPPVREQLEALPGVGRKVAGVVLGEAFGEEVLPVDTHVFRVARRLGLSSAGTPEKVEEELTALVPPAHRMAVHHRLIAHGRRICSAKKPACPDCPLLDLCQHPARGGEQPCT